MAKTKVEMLTGIFSGAGFVIFIVLVRLHLILSEENIFANTKYGVLQGRRRRYNYGLDDGITQYVEEYIGVPYAAPPVGELRWMPPEDVLTWTDIRNASSFGSACPQLRNNDLKLCQFKYQDEDCLYLNIFSPYESSKPNKRYPVMLYIHGGSYVRGTGNRFNGTALAQYGAVIVSINYRLFALGFMSTGDDNLSGNYGFLDQIQALKWTRDNIHHFRGDSSSVTIFGNSAGASSVGLLMVSPLAKGLFHRVIAHSGSPNAHYSVYRRGPEELQSQTLEVAAGLQCTSATIEEAITCMRELHWTKFLWENIGDIIVCNGMDPPFKPIANSEAIPGQIHDLIKGQDLHNVTYLQGLLTDEYGYFGDGQESYVLNILKRVYRDNKSVLKTVLFHYIDWLKQNHTMNTDQDWLDVTYDAPQVVSDSVMVAPISELVQWLALRGDRQVYFYVFDNDEMYHSIDLNYVFGVAFTQQDVDEFGFCSDGCNASVEDAEFSRFMMKMWAGFAKEGRPVVQKETWNTSIDWRQPNPYTLDYLYLSKQKIEMRQNFKAEKVALWNQLLPEIFNEEPPKDKPPVLIKTGDNMTWILLSCVVGILLVILAFVFYLTARRCKSGIGPRTTTLS